MKKFFQLIGTIITMVGITGGILGWGILYCIWIAFLGLCLFEWFRE